MSVRSKHLKLIGAASAAALSAGALAAPSLAITPTMTATQVPYSCLSGATLPTANFSFDAPTTLTMVAGQKVALPGTMHVDLPHGATNLLINTLHWDHFTGVVTAGSPSQTIGLNLNVPMTAVGATASDPTPVDTDPGNAYLDYPTAGTKTISAGSFTATLKGYKNGSPVPDGPTNPLKVPCVPTDTTKTPLLLGGATPVQITVTKDDSTSAAKAAYAKAKHVVTAKDTVKGKNYGLIGSGKVKFLLKHGTKTVAKSVALNKKGIAAFAFKNVTAKGKYTLTAKFGGNGGLNASSSTVHFKI